MLHPHSFHRHLRKLPFLQWTELESGRQLLSLPAAVIELSFRKEIRFPHSLGLLYSAFTYYTGFKVNSRRIQSDGPGPYGEPRYVDFIKKHLIDIREDGSFHLDMRYFDYCTGLTMTNGRFNALFGGPPRSPESELTQREMDLAASIQVVTEEIVVKLAKDIQRSTRQKNLCLAGGVALNCVANGKLLREGVFDNIWIQPAAGDAGGALARLSGVSPDAQSATMHHCDRQDEGGLSWS